MNLTDKEKRVLLAALAFAADSAAATPETFDQDVETQDFLDLISKVEGGGA